LKLQSVPDLMHKFVTSQQYHSTKLTNEGMNKEENESKMN